MTYDLFIDEEFQWNILEKNTDLVVGRFFFQEEAEDYLRFLKSGGAFNGWTPPFVLRKVNIEYDLNQEFENIFL